MTTFPYGVTLTPTTSGYDLHRKGTLTGRVRVRRDFSGRRWLADIFAFDGFRWELDCRTRPAALPQTRAAVRDYAAELDRQAYVASGDCHAHA